MVYFLKKFIETPLKTLDYVFWTDYAIKMHNRFIGFHNSNYSFDRSQVAFIHVPKCGGTSLHKILACNNQHVRYVNLDMHRPISNLCNPEEFCYVTIMRNPIERVWSYYQMARRGSKDNPYTRFSLKGLDFFLNHCWEVQNMACRYYSGRVYIEPDINTLYLAKRNLSKFKFILDFDNFDASLINFSSTLNIPIDNIPHERKSSYDLFGNSDRELIASSNQLDIKLYEFWKRQL